MRKIPTWILITAVWILIFVIFAVVQDNQFDDGLRKYDKGDFKGAMQLWRPLAEKGDAEAQYNLGAMHQNGRGVPQDYTEAVKWYRRAAEQGLADAQLKLAVMYIAGIGVPQDFVQAYMWINLAATMGDQRAIDLKEGITKELAPTTIEEGQRLSREWRAKHNK